MGITGLIPFIEKASRRANVDEFDGCTVAIDSYCWLHKGAFACADKLVRGEDTDIYIRYCLKYITMLLSKNIKPILVFDGRHLPAKALTEAKRRESRTVAKKRAAELLSLGKTEEARSYMRRSVDITHSMALALIKECRKRNVDCIVAPYEADAQLAYLNIEKIAHLVITEDSDLILFGCSKVLFKMDLDGVGTLVEKDKLPLVMKCPIEHYRFDKFRQMCIMSGCDYLASLPGIGLAKARQFVVATQDPDFSNALKKLPSFFNKSSLIVTDEYREHFLKAEATFKHQYVYDPLKRQMVRLTDPDDDDVEVALCVNAGQLLDEKIAFQLALGNLDPFTLKKMDDWDPDYSNNNYENVKTTSWDMKGVSSHPSIWKQEFLQYLSDQRPWQKAIKKTEPALTKPLTRPRKKELNLVSKYVPETQDESLTMESLRSMYCVEPPTKKPKLDKTNSEEVEEILPCTQDLHNKALQDSEILGELSQDKKSPIIENKRRSFQKLLANSGHTNLRQFSKFPRTVMDNSDTVESKFFNNTVGINKSTGSREIEHNFRNPFKVRTDDTISLTEADTQCSDEEDVPIDSSLKVNSLSDNSIELERKSPILVPSPRNPFKLKNGEPNQVLCEDSQSSVIDNTYPYETLVTPVASQQSFGGSPTRKKLIWNGNETSRNTNSDPGFLGIKKNLNGNNRTCRVSGLKKTLSLPSNQPTLLSKFGFQKKPVMKT